MKRTISVPIVKDMIWMDRDVVYTQLPGWCGLVTQSLKMTVMYHTPCSVPGIFEKRSVQKKLPCIVFICGGGWLNMSIDAYLPGFEYLARLGYVIASVQYRSSNQVVFPAQAEEIKTAIRYLRAHADKYSIDADNIGIMGDSAGGHLASFVGLNNGNKDLDKGDNLEYSSDVKAVCPWYGPAEFIDNKEVRDNPVVRLLWGGADEKPELYKFASPVTHVSKDAPPFLLLHGSNDPAVPVEQSEILHDKLIEAGAQADVYIIKDASHADLHFFQPMVLDLIDSFFAKHLKH